MDKAKLIAKLNEAIALELCGVLQYNQYAQVLLGEDRKIWKGFFIDSSDESLGHARLFAERVIALGGQPVCEPEPVKQTTDVKEMLANGVDHEARAVKVYTEALDAAQGNPAYCNLLEDQIDQENRDMEEMLMYLGKVQKVGSGKKSASKSA
jgi:bacterioferritin